MSFYERGRYGIFPERRRQLPLGERRIVGQHAIDAGPVVHTYLEVIDEEGAGSAKVTTVVSGDHVVIENTDHGGFGSLDSVPFQHKLPTEILSGEEVNQRKFRTVKSSEHPKSRKITFRPI